MKTVFLDSNVILDAILDRSGAENAKQILQFGRDLKISKRIIRYIYLTRSILIIIRTRS